MNLTERVLAYQREARGLPELQRCITQIAYYYPLSRNGFTEDDCGDFALFFYHRIPAIIRRFRWSGKPFEAYLLATLKWQIISYAESKRKRRQQRAILSGPELSEDIDIVREVPGPADIFERKYRIGTATAVVPVIHPAASRCSDRLPQLIARSWRLDESGMLEDAALRRRVMILVMKGCELLTESELQIASRLTGMRYAELLDICTRLRESHAERRQRRAVLQLRRNRAFLRLHFLEHEAALMPPGERRDATLAKAGKCLRRIRAAQSDLAAVPATPSHREIAEALGIPKGTVDSSIYFMRNAILDNGRARRRKRRGRISCANETRA